MEDEEVWATVPDCNGYYEVSNHGRVRSLARVIIRTDGKPFTVPSRILTPAHDNKGYPVVSICVVTRKKLIKVHRLVAEAFCVKPEGCDVVNHIDNTVDNNHWTNLEWTTPAGNIKHRDNQRRGKCHDQYGESNSSAKYSIEQILEVRRLNDLGFDRGYISKATGVYRKSLRGIIIGKSWNFPEAWP